MVTMGHKAKILNPSKGQVGRSGGLTEMRAMRVGRVRREYITIKKELKTMLCTETSMHTHTSKHTCTHTYSQACTQGKDAQANIHTHRQVCTHTHSQACTHRQACMHAHTGKHAHT